MYCKNCGRELRPDTIFCSACGHQVQEIHQYTPANTVPEYTDEEKSRDRRRGLGKAIVGTVFSLVSVFLLVFGCMFYAIGLEYYDEDVIFAGLFFMMTALPLSIISIVFGAKSIGAFKRNGREGKARPIATLILGIESLSSGIIMTFMNFVYIMLFLVVLSIA